ncbi:MAG: S16 family serine protease [Syntrophobacteraceae bacterium]
MDETMLDRTIPSRAASECDAPGMDAGEIRKALNRVYVDEAVKDRLAEFLLLGARGGNGGRRRMLCLLAPPGMGKSFIVKSLCSELSWRLIDIPVGELADGDGTVLGRRRADLNATAGRIVHALSDHIPGRTVVLLENIDRSESIQGAAVDFDRILEYTQNHAITNKYISRRIDFSRVYLIATASNYASIPQGMRENMDMVALPSYSEPEKLFIAREHILPDLATAYGLRDRVSISERALRFVIRRYTQEAGVAELRKRVERICAMSLKRLATRRADGSALRISSRNIGGFLGEPRYPYYSDGGPDEVGVVKALGRGERGGHPVILEVLAVGGDGKMACTGNVDKTFQESAMVAMGHVRSRSRSLGLSDDFYRRTDVHFHILEGTTPKRGVSAGVAILTGLVSALTGRPVRRDVGMTGEISLYGRVLGVRNVRDKVLGAQQAGIRTVFLPRENAEDLKLAPSDVKKTMRIVLVETVDEVLDLALAGAHESGVNRGAHE